MPLTAEDIGAAYRLILGRDPAAQDIENVTRQHETLETLRLTLLNSDEFHRKFDRICTSFVSRLKPILVSLQVPGAVDATLFEALTTEDTLQPASHVDPQNLKALYTKPRPERLKLRHVYGDLGAGAGEALRLPHRYLCSIARPGPRIYRLYRMACGPEGEAEMSFGTYLEYSLDSTPHRVELDNGQVRRLAGQQDMDGLGREPALLARALHNALAPDMLLGLFERPEALALRLSEDGFLSAPPPGLANHEAMDTEEGYAAALETLGDDARGILDAYTAWDGYLYEVCEGLLFPPSEPEAD